jgi:hypothetical protein
METLHSAAIDGTVRAEGFMLDVAFIALGLVVLALMCFYANALRQL